MQDARTDAYDPAPAWGDDEEWYDVHPAEETGVPTRPALSRVMVVLGLLQVVYSAWAIFAPHRIVGSVFDGWRDQRPWVGPLLLLAGGLLIWTALLPVRRRPIVVAGLVLTFFN